MDNIISIILKDLNKLEEKIDKTIINQNKYIRSYNKILLTLNFIEIITIIYILWR